MTSIYANPSHTANIMAFCAPELKAEYLTESLLEVLNNQEKVNALESSRSTYTNFEYEVGRKYIKVWSYLMSEGERLRVIDATCSLIRTLVKYTNQHHTKHLQRCSLYDHSVGR